MQSNIVYDTTGSSLKALISQFNSGAKNDPKRHYSQNMSQEDPRLANSIPTNVNRRQFAINRQQSVEIHEEESDLSIASQKKMPEVPPLMME